MRQKSPFSFSLSIPLRIQDALNFCGTARHGSTFNSSSDSSHCFDDVGAILLRRLSIPLRIQAFLLPCNESIKSWNFQFLFGFKVLTSISLKKRSAFTFNSSSDSSCHLGGGEAVRVQLLSIPLRIQVIVFPDSAVEISHRFQFLFGFKWRPDDLLKLLQTQLTFNSSSDSRLKPKHVGLSTG